MTGNTCADLDIDAVIAAADVVGARLLTPHRCGVSAIMPATRRSAGRAVRARDTSRRRRGPCGDRRRAALLGARGEMARDLGRRLGGAGVCVVSGAALRHRRGVASRRARRRTGARSRSWGRASTCGTRDRVPISSNGSRRVGSVVSEYPPGVPAEPHRFPARNRIVVALASALVVVEGAGSSGSRISVDHALDLGREVFAVPGTGHEPARRGPARADPRGSHHDPRCRRPAGRSRLSPRVAPTRTDRSSSPEDERLVWSRPWSSPRCPTPCRTASRCRSPGPWPR